MCVYMYDSTCFLFADIHDPFTTSVFQAGTKVFGIPPTPVLPMQLLSHRFHPKPAGLLTFYI